MITNSKLEDAGLKEHAIHFNQFISKKSRKSVARIFYHLLGIDIDCM